MRRSTSRKTKKSKARHNTAVSTRRRKIPPADATRCALDAHALRYPRGVTAALLGRSLATILRLEAKGVLTPLRDTPNGMVFHPAAQVRRLAGNVPQRQSDEAADV